MTLTEQLFEMAQVPDEAGADPQTILFNAADALKPQPPIQWLVDGLLSEGSLSLLVGEAGSKKTWLAIDLAICVANGQAWLNRPTHAGPVLLIDEESGSRRLARRLGQALRGHAAGAATPLHWCSLAAFNFSEMEDVNRLHGLILRTGARLVVVDALADVMPGKDENAVKDVQPIFQTLRRMAESTQAALLVIHHSNKAGGYRGSTAIKGAVDNMFLVEAKSDSDRLEVRSEKVRDVEPLAFAAHAFFESDPWGNLERFYLKSTTHRSEAIHLPASHEYVLGYLVDHGPSDLETIAAAATVCTYEAARKALYMLAKEQMQYAARINPLERTGPGHRAIYDVTSKGREYLQAFRER